MAPRGPGHPHELVEDEHVGPAIHQDVGVIDHRSQRVGDREVGGRYGVAVLPYDVRPDLPPDIDLVGVAVHGHGVVVEGRVDKVQDGPVDEVDLVVLGPHAGVEHRDRRVLRVEVEVVLDADGLGGPPWN